MALRRRSQIPGVYRILIATIRLRIVSTLAIAVECANDFKWPGNKKLSGFKSVKYKYWKNKGVPHLEPTFPAGNVSDVMHSRKTIGEVYVEFYRKFKETVDYRKKNNIKRNDFMQLLIELMNNNTIDKEEKRVFKGGHVTITMTDVAAQSVTFLLAGFETSATTMSFCLYELALNPDIQDRLREDIDTVLEKHDGNITYEAIQEMNYLDNVVSETLRKHPTAPFLIRECTKEYKIPDSEIVVDRRSQVVVPVMGLHYDPKYFPDPTRFDPDRFTEEVKNTRHHYSYLPFGEGPRICMVKYKYWKKKGVPHLQPTFPAGNVSDLMYSRKSIGEVYADFYRKFEGKMKMMIQIMIDCGKELGKYLEESARKQDIVEVKDILARFTTDIIASAAFGIQCNCLKNPNAEFREWGRKLIEPSFNQKFRDLLYLTMPDLAISLGIPNIPSHLANFFIKVVEETVGHREKNNIKRNDFMQLLIQLLNNNNIDEEEKQVTKGGDVAITMTEVAAQSVIFFVAGFETSATTLSFCLYELALNPDIQDRLREEIDTVLEKYDGNITYEGIQEMSYLDNVLSETLRKHPPAPFVFRECTKEYKIPDSEVVVDTGSKVLVPIMGLHYDPKYFPDPTRFDPDRFTEEVKKTRHHYSYLPFGEGPRICIGMRFALLQTKVGLVTLLSKYQFNVCEKTAVPFVYDPKSLILFMKGGTWLQVKNRSN
ncbi:hypothetical protein ANN_23443 [Periplaneta americana]|uniref:Cytochrome P450 n=1 Tax=Periplaneta americana TaxID=6978 RepID=A0ABQ8SMK4_PERAM|nr:hypothetical protein ANN_23443 [Periplaneta americana]